MENFSGEVGYKPSWKGKRRPPDEVIDMSPPDTEGELRVETLLYHGREIRLVAVEHRDIVSGFELTHFEDGKKILTRNFEAEKMPTDWAGRIDREIEGAGMVFV